MTDWTKIAAHKGSASLRPRCTRSGSSLAEILFYTSLYHYIPVYTSIIRCFIMYWGNFFSRKPSVGHGLLFVQASRSLSDTPHSVGLLSSQKPLPDNTQHSLQTDRQTSMLPTGYETAFPASYDRKPTSWIAQPLESSALELDCWNIHLYLR
jgi:hypothetical protein